MRPPLIAIVSCIPLFGRLWYLVLCIPLFGRLWYLVLCFVSEVCRSFGRASGIGVPMSADRPPAFSDPMFAPQPPGTLTAPQQDLAESSLSRMRASASVSHGAPAICACPLYETTSLVLGVVRGPVLVPVLGLVLGVGTRTGTGTSTSTSTSTSTRGSTGSSTSTSTGPSTRGSTRTSTRTSTGTSTRSRD